MNYGKYHKRNKMIEYIHNVGFALCLVISRHASNIRDICSLFMCLLIMCLPLVFLLRRNVVF